MKKIVYAASAAAVVLGAGTAALAASGSGALPGTANTGALPGAANTGSLLAAAPASPAPAQAGHDRKGRPGMRSLERALHAQWVTRKPGSSDSYVTHDAIRGQVTAVSATSITVKAADGVSQTYAVNGSTKVRLHKAGTGRGTAATTGAIGDVHTGDQVGVAGTGTTSLTAEHIVDRVK